MKLCSHPHSSTQPPLSPALPSTPSRPQSPPQHQTPPGRHQPCLPLSLFPAQSQPVRLAHSGPRAATAATPAQRQFPKGSTGPVSPQRPCPGRLLLTSLGAAMMPRGCRSVPAPRAPRSDGPALRGRPGLRGAEPGRGRAGAPQSRAAAPWSTAGPSGAQHAGKALPPLLQQLFCQAWCRSPGSPFSAQPRRSLASLLPWG